MEEKKYQIKTMQDVFNCVTMDNINNFIIDFRGVIETYIAFRNLSKTIGEVEGLPPGLAEVSSEGYTWIDDGKHDKTVKIAIK